MNEKTLIKKVEELKKNHELNKRIKKRFLEFHSFENKSNNSWFSELCFCILTANSRALTAIKIQKILGSKGFLTYSQEKLSNTIRENHHRFHNNKSKYIIQARKFKKIKDIVKKLNSQEDIIYTREWIAKNIKGLGFKESSHFLRNVGFTNIAILDRHIINLMFDHKMISFKPKLLSKSIYLEIENKFNKFAKKLGMNSSLADMYLWYIKTGEVLK